jgi:hypothetical protein
MFKKSVFPIELTRPLQPDAALPEEPRHDAVDDRRSHLGLDVVADDRKLLLLEPPLPVLLARDEHRDRVHERASGFQDLLHVPLRSLFAPHREVVDDHVGLRVAEKPDDVGGGAWSLVDDLGEVLAQAVVRHAARDRNSRAARRRTCRVVGPRSLAEVAAATLFLSMSIAALN